MAAKTGEQMEDSVRQALIGEIAEIINGQRNEVVAGVREAVTNHIKEKSPTACLTLVRRSSSGAVLETLPMTPNKRYATALISFIRKQSFEGTALDSGLTDSTSDVVANVFSERVGEKAEEISQRAMPILISDERFIYGLSESLAGLYSGTIPAQLKSKLVAILSHKMTDSLTQTIDTTTAASIKASVLKVTAASVSSPIATKITIVLVKSLSVALKPIILKLMASAAFKAVLVSKLKAIIVGALLGAFIKIIGVKLGLTAGAAFMWVLIPVVLGWLAYEYFSFPGHLAEKVADSVAGDIQNNFSDTSNSMALSIVEKLIVDGASAVAAKIINEDIIASLIASSLEEANQV